MNLKAKFAVFFLTASLVLTSSPKSFAYYVSGDVDDDGIVRIADALLALRYIAGTQTFSYAEVHACDVFGGGNPLPSPDGKCDVMDVMFILRKAYGLTSY